jgi:hypothetical protein
MGPVYINHAARLCLIVAAIPLPSGADNFHQFDRNRLNLSRQRIMRQLPFPDGNQAAHWNFAAFNSLKILGM